MKGNITPDGNGTRSLGSGSDRFIINSYSLDVSNGALINSDAAINDRLTVSRSSSLTGFPLIVNSNRAEFNGITMQNASASGGSTIRVLSSDSHVMAMQIGSPSSGAYAAYIGTTTSLTMNFLTNNTVRGAILSGGGWQTTLATNTVGGTPQIEMLNTDTGAGQSFITASFGGTMKGKWRADFAGNISYVTNGGDHYFYTGGDFGTGTEKLRIQASGSTLSLPNASTATTANAGAQTLPSNPVGFLNIDINGTSRKIPYYAT